MAKKPRITLYTTSKCTHCRQLRDYLRQNKVPFGEQNIERNQRAFREFQKYGGRGVPLLVIGQQVVRGFQPDRLKNLLSKAGFHL